MKLLLTATLCLFATADILNQAINQSWAGLIDRNIDRHPFLIHRPYSETPGDAVSEGVGYGLILALYNDDQNHFDMLLDGAEATMWNGQFYDWRVDESNHKIAYGAATDAEQDIAAMLFLAARRADRGDWRGDRRDWYHDRAMLIIENFWNNGVQDHIIRAGYGWGGQDFVNVGYFAPAWYRLFQDFDPNHDWRSVIDRCYEILQNSPGYDKGLVPDWMTPWGGQTQNLGYNAYLDGKALFKDAIRVYWRIGTDFLWFQERRAHAFLENAFRFLQTHGGIQGSNFFQMDGELLPSGDHWVFDDGHKTRPRREHSHLTIGMWAFPVGIFGSKTEAIEELTSFYVQGNGFWGKTEGPETIYDNELYFDQFLASFGALFLADRWNLISA